MGENILEKIIKNKIEKIDLLKKSISLKSLDEKIGENKSFINFKDKIQNNINNFKEIDFFNKSIFSIFFLIIFSKMFSDILYFF